MAQRPADVAARPTVIITGASSGLGRAFLEHFAAHATPPHRIVGIDKQPLAEGTGDNPVVVSIALDVTRPATELRSTLRLQMHHLDPVVLVIHCAGVRGLVPAVPIATSADVAAAETLEAMDAATLLRTYETNVVGTLNVVRALLPSLRLAAAQSLRPRVVVLSSRMGSIAANDKGGGYAYRGSKAALNAVLKSLSVDVPEVHFAMVHPGRVETGLVCVKEEGAISPEESLLDLLPLIERFGVDASFTTACFLDRFGTPIPW